MIRIYKLIKSQDSYNLPVDIICGKDFNPEGEHCEDGYHKETCHCLIIGRVLNQSTVDKILDLTFVGVSETTYFLE
jgi:hypothetical protein